MECLARWTHTGVVTLVMSIPHICLSSSEPSPGSSSIFGSPLCLSSPGHLPAMPNSVFLLYQLQFCSCLTTLLLIDWKPEGQLSLLTLPCIPNI